jgi:hypothetical protein
MIGAMMSNLYNRLILLLSDVNIRSRQTRGSDDQFTCPCISALGPSRSEPALLSDRSCLVAQRLPM